jgi:hypothetical protein
VAGKHPAGPGKDGGPAAHRTDFGVGGGGGVVFLAFLDLAVPAGDDGSDASLAGGSGLTSRFQVISLRSSSSNSGMLRALSRRLLY